MPVPKLRFIIDRQYDERMVYQMLQAGDPAGRWHRAASMRLPQRVASVVARSTWPECRRLIKRIVGERYGAVSHEMIDTKRLYQKSWNQINDPFFNFIARKTRHDWEFDAYQCVVSAFHRGISNWNSNIIARTWEENPYTMRKITAHELIIAHIFSIVRRTPALSASLTDHATWKIAEISAWCLTGYERTLLRLWPWVSPEQRFPLRHNYPTLVRLQARLGKIYQHTASFNYFFQQAVRMVQGGR